jgi:hypothetical protein
MQKPHCSLLSKPGPSDLQVVATAGTGSFKRGLTFAETGMPITIKVSNSTGALQHCHPQQLLARVSAGTQDMLQQSTDVSRMAESARCAVIGQQALEKYQQLLPRQPSCVQTLRDREQNPGWPHV